MAGFYLQTHCDGLCHSGITHYLNADCLGYLPGLSSVSFGLKNQVFDTNLPLPLLTRVAVDNVCSPRGLCRIPIRIVTMVHRYFVF